MAVILQYIVSLQGFEILLNLIVTNLVVHVVCGGQSIQKFKFLIMQNNPEQFSLRNIFFYRNMTATCLSLRANRHVTVGPWRAWLILSSNWEITLNMKPDQRAVLIRLTGRRSAKLTADMSLNSSAASLTVFFLGVFSTFSKLHSTLTQSSWLFLWPDCGRIYAGMFAGTIKIVCDCRCVQPGNRTKKGQ